MPAANGGVLPSAKAAPPGGLTRGALSTDPIRIGDKQVEAAVGLMREAWSAKEATVQARDEAVTELSDQVWELQARLQEREERVARLEEAQLATFGEGVQHEAELLKMEQAHRQELELIAADAQEQIQMLETRLSQELRAAREADAEERAELEAELEATRREGAGLAELLVEARDQLEALDAQTQLVEKELANKEREKRAATEALVAELGTKALEQDSLLKEMAHLQAVHEESLELKALESARKIRSYEVQVGVRGPPRAPLGPLTKPWLTCRLTHLRATLPAPARTPQVAEYESALEAVRSDAARFLSPVKLLEFSPYNPRKTGAYSEHVPRSHGSGIPRPPPSAH